MQKILIAVVAWFAFLALLCGASGMWMYSHKDEFKAEADQARLDGAAAGPGMEQARCVDEGFVRQETCGVGNILCEVNAQLWMVACLGTARPTPDFCKDVPAEDALVDTVPWVIAECTKRGKAQDNACQRLHSGVQKYCDDPDHYAPAPE